MSALASIRAIANHVSRGVNNEVAFPHSSVVRFKFPPQGEWPVIDIWWHDGGMKPPLREELAAKDQELPREGMMFIGDSGKIVAGFRWESPHMLPVGVALRTRKRLVYNAKKMEITSVLEANQYLTREYRKGWEL